MGGNIENIQIICKKYTIIQKTANKITEFVDFKYIKTFELVQNDENG